MGKTAILLGASGLTGGCLLKLLLDNDEYETIKLFSRKPLNTTHPKIEEHICDLLELENEAESFTGDVVFCCIGTTKKKTPDKDLYRKIDFGIPSSAAALAKQNDIRKFIVISAMGADAYSGIFYNKVKGEMELEVLSYGLKSTYILKPSFIGGDRKEKRLGESLALGFMKTFGFLFPKKYKIIEPETIAKAMCWLAKNHFPKSKIPSDTIKEIAAKWT